MKYLIFFPISYEIIVFLVNFKCKYDFLGLEWYIHRNTCRDSVKFQWIQAGGLYVVKCICVVKCLYLYSDSGVFVMQKTYLFEEI